MDNLQRASPPESFGPAKRGFFFELARFLTLLIFFSGVSLLVVMFPTVVARVSFLLGLESQSAFVKGLPATPEREDWPAFLAARRLIPQDDRLIIPKINVDAPLVHSQKADNDRLLEDLKKGVIHYPGTAYPGERGNAFLTGHSSYYWWNGGKYNQVFANLDKLAAGDLVYLYQNGGEFIYQIEKSFIVLPTQVEVLAQTGEPIVTLMTCVPLGTNLKRLIVQGKLLTQPSLPRGALKQFEGLPASLPLS